MQQASMWVHCRMNNLLMNSGNKPGTKLSSCTVFPVSSEVPTAVVLILSSQLVKKKKKEMDRERTSREYDLVRKNDGGGAGMTDKVSEGWIRSTLTSNSSNSKYKQQLEDIVMFPHLWKLSFQSSRPFFPPFFRYSGNRNAKTWGDSSS